MGVQYELVRDFLKIITVHGKVAESFEELGRPGSETGLVITVAPWQVWYAGTDSEYVTLGAGASRFLCDGIGLRWILWLSGRKVSRLTGRELMELVDGGRLWRDRLVCLIGGSLGARRAIQERHPDWLIIGGVFSPEVDRDSILGMVGMMKEHGSDRVILALGSPKQEIWAASLLGEYRALYVGVGGAIEVVAGELPSPRRVVSRLGLEWVQRAAANPRVMVPRVVQAASIVPLAAVWSVRERVSCNRGSGENPSSPGSI
jgi:N-acetylglucosaminyldiphosphoundecaprenol N-acetyl-beta-D-mannosaminyltransferase